MVYIPLHSYGADPNCKTDRQRIFHYTHLLPDSQLYKVIRDDHLRNQLYREQTHWSMPTGVGDPIRGSLIELTDSASSMAPGLSASQSTHQMFNSTAQTIKHHSYSPSRWTEHALRAKIERSRVAQPVFSSGHNH